MHATSWVGVRDLGGSANVSWHLHNSSTTFYLGGPVSTLTCMQELVKASYDVYRNRTEKKIPIDRRQIAIRGPRPFGHTTMALEALRFFTQTNRVIYVAPTTQQLRDHKVDEAGLLAKTVATCFASFEADLKKANLIKDMEYVVVVDNGSLVPDGFFEKVEKLGIDAFYILLG